MTANPIQLARQEADRWAQLKATILADEVDPVAIMDSLEGETELLEALAMLGERIIELENETLPGLAFYIAKLESRRARISKTALTLRTAILSSMERAGIDQPVKTPLFTMTVARRAPGLLITDEAEIPSEYFVDVDPKLDKKAVKTALKDGEPVPGARLDNGSTSLTIRIA